MGESTELSDSDKGASETANRVGCWRATVVRIYGKRLKDGETTIMQ